jgi:glycosyltransferase involved in cell wall biosynthesis
MESVISRAEWQTDTLPFLLAGDLLLHVAAYEGVPFAIIEAMAAGLPCVVTRDFASEVPIFDDRSVLFLDDTAELADRIRNQTKLSSIAKGGRQLVERAFSLGAMAAAYEQLYRETARK